MRFEVVGLDRCRPPEKRAVRKVERGKDTLKKELWKIYGKEEVEKTEPVTKRRTQYIDLGSALEIEMNISRAMPWVWFWR